jgi:peptide/nickel transport system substrate-binding protein
VSADDVIFTVLRTQDPLIRSPRRASWDGVEIKKINDQTIAFILERPFPPFIENLTMGILPQHLWQSVDPEQFPFNHLNINPIGSGPFKVSSIKHTEDGIPRSYTLSSFNKYARGEPYIEELFIEFFPSDKERLGALKDSQIELAGGLMGSHAGELVSERVNSKILPRVFAVFLNQNKQPLFAEKSIRVALQTAIDKRKIVDEVLYGFGLPIESPLSYLPLSQARKDLPRTDFEGASIAKEMLIDAGWQEDEETGIMERTVGGKEESLSFTLSTSQTPELQQSALMLKDMWKDIGVELIIETHPTNDLIQSVVRPREYEAILFGQVVGRELDLFAFWHSSQRNDPGLNIAQYTNPTADDILEEARGVEDRNERFRILRDFDKLVKEDVSALFIYVPEYVYVIPRKLKGFDLGIMTTPSERFMNVHEWYLETYYLLSVFNKL